MGFRPGLGRGAGFRFRRSRLGLGDRTAQRTLLGGPVRTPADCLARNWTVREWPDHGRQGCILRLHNRCPGQPSLGSLVQSYRCRAGSILPSAGRLVPTPLASGRLVKTLADTGCPARSLVGSECPVQRGDERPDPKPQGRRPDPKRQRCPLTRTDRERPDRIPAGNRCLARTCPVDGSLDRLGGAATASTKFPAGQNPRTSLSGPS
ncbi:hypothetical protein GCM10027360_11020 [Amycolatopsis echigonensis]